MPNDPANISLPLGPIGQPVRRKEDQRLLTGKGRFSDDFSLPGQAYAVMVRSPYPHARIRSVDAQPARAMPGVRLVLTGQDLASQGANPLPGTSGFERPDGIPGATPRTIPGSS